MLRFDLVSRFYQVGPERIAAIHDLSFELPTGEALCVVGPSGSGKTTVLNIAGCMDRPDTGVAYLGDVSVGNLPTSERTELRRRNIGFVFQAFHLLPGLSVIENVLLPLSLIRVEPAEAQQRAKEVLGALELDGLEHRRPSQLSAGQRQRVAVARAVAKSPELIVADEPTGNLDATSAERLIDLLLAASIRSGASLLVATHDPRIVERLPNRLDPSKMGEADG